MTPYFATDRLCASALLDRLLSANCQWKLNRPTDAFPKAESPSATSPSNAQPGLTKQAEVSAAGGPPVVFGVGRDDTIEIEVKVPAISMSWYVIRSADPDLINFSDDKAIAARRPIIIAHRGGVVSPRSPECSPTAIRLAADMGSPGL